MVVWGEALPILNNYLTMERIQELKSSPLTRDLVFEIHKLVTEKTLNDPTASGRFRRPDEVIEVGNDYGNVYHSPPPAEELSKRMKQMWAFANATPLPACHESQSRTANRADGLDEVGPTRPAQERKKRQKNRLFCSR